MSQARSFALAFVFVFGLANQSSAQTTWYVDIGLASSGSPGLNNGQSWQNAFHSLNSALSNPLLQSGQEVWVAKGTYFPDAAGLVDPKEATFLVPNGISLLGGFVNGMSSPTMRFPSDFQRTILDGVVNSSDRSYHVVTTIGGNSKVTIDGFLVRNGIAKGTATAVQGDPTRSGGGIYSVGTRLSLKNCFIRENIALDQGGGLFFSGGESGKRLEVFVSEFDSNTSARQGGGAFVEYFSGSTVDASYIYNSKFRRNLAGSDSTHQGAYDNQQGGGGLAIGERGAAAHIAFCNDLFVDNFSRGWGSAVWHVTTPFAPSYNSNGVFTWSHCTFHGNYVLVEPRDTTPAGTAIYLTGTVHVDGTGSMSNSIFYENPRLISVQLIDGIFLDISSGVPTYWAEDHNQIQAPTATTPLPGYGNIKPNPQFTNTAIGDYSLMATSPCLDKASDDFIPPDYPDGDLDGNTAEAVEYDYTFGVRIVDLVAGQTCGSSPYTCGEGDMGAYERH
ncbi:MAG: hypothetical protein R3F33_03900 [Planctomycetota bacterium]